MAICFVTVLIVAGCGTSDEGDKKQPSGPALPRLEQGEPCPRTTGGRDAPKVAITLGDGPAYPVLGMTAPPPDPRGVAELRDDPRKEGLYVHKTLWAVRPGPGTVRVDGRQLDGTAQLLFQGRRKSLRRALPLPRSDRRWSFAPTATALPGPGCFGFRVVTTEGTDVIVFRAVLEQR